MLETIGTTTKRKGSNGGEGGGDNPLFTVQLTEKGEDISFINKMDFENHQSHHNLHDIQSKKNSEPIKYNSQSNNKGAQYQLKLDGQDILSQESSRTSQWKKKEEISLANTSKHVKEKLSEQRRFSQLKFQNNLLKQGAFQKGGKDPSTIILAQTEKAKEDDGKFMKIKKRIEEVIKGKTQQQIFQKGVRHFRDAEHQRPPRNIFDKDKYVFGKLIIFFYEMQWTTSWKLLQSLFSFLFLVQTFIEPQNLAQTFSDNSASQYVYVQEIIILVFCTLDNLLGLCFLGSARHNRLLNIIDIFQRYFLQIAFFVDFYIFWHTSLLGVRFSACLRPLWFIQFQPEIEKTVKAIFCSFNKVIDIFLFFIFISLFWGYMGYNLFQDYATQFSEDKYFAFGTAGTSMLGMYTLLSMDTYPSIMKNIVIDSPYNLIFFIPFVAINLFFLLFIPVAVIFENYKNQRAIIMIKEELLIKKALTYSFICISHPNNDNYISKDQFFDLLNSFYYGSGYRDRIEDIYVVLNISDLDRLSLVEFLDVYDLIKSSEILYNTSNKVWDSIREFCNRYFRFNDISLSGYWNTFILIIVMINTTMVIVTTVLPDSDSSTSVDDILTNIDLLFNLIYVIDVIIKIIGLGINNYFNDTWNNFDFIMVLISIITIFGLNYIYFLKKAKSTKLVKLAKLQKVLKIFRSLRSLKLIKVLQIGTDALLRVQKLCHKVALCIPSIYCLAKTYFLFSFSYAIIGTYLFNTDYNAYKVYSSNLIYFTLIKILFK